MSLPRLVGLLLMALGLVASAYPQGFAFLTGAAEPTSRSAHPRQRRAKC